MAGYPTGPWMTVSAIKNQMERNGFKFDSGSATARLQQVRSYLERAGSYRRLFAKKTVDSRGRRFCDALFALRDMLPRAGEGENQPPEPAPDPGGCCIGSLSLLVPIAHSVLLFALTNRSLDAAAVAEADPQRQKRKLRAYSRGSQDSSEEEQTSEWESDDGGEEDDEEEISDEEDASSKSSSDSGDDGKGKEGTNSGAVLIPLLLPPSAKCGIAQPW